jgi:hypothetical protein
MSPAKKRKIAAAAAAAQLMDVDDTQVVFSTAEGGCDVEIAKLLEQHVKTVQILRQHVNDLTSHSTTATNNITDDEQHYELSTSSSLVALATLKCLQRQLAQTSEARTTTSNEQRTEMDRLSLACENITYERNYLHNEITNVRQWKSISRGYGNE